MKDHILEFTSSGARLTKRRGHLIVEVEDRKTEIPLDDIFGVLILGEDIWLSTNVISALLERDVSIQFCDSRYMPTGILTPLVGHGLTRSRQLAQMSLSIAQNGRLWQKVVIQKILNQANVLSGLGLDARPLLKYSKEVQTEDLKNHEAQAARIYWPTLFGTDFRRDQNAGKLNSFLNYGYAVIRSSVARYTVACGLNPALGIFHRNLENPFCLVDDLMEPFRPFSDALCVKFEAEEDLTTAIKRELASVLETRVEYKNEQKSLRSAMQEYCQSFSRAVLLSDWREFDTAVNTI